MIIKPDQYIDHYIYEKQTNPDANLVVKAFNRKVVEDVDRIVELAHGERDFIKSESDWKVMEGLLQFWASRWPDEYRSFKATVSDIRQTRSEDGYSESREIKYVGALPSQRFMKMIKAIFPAQQWDKKFVSKFVKRFPLFKVGDRINKKYI